MGDDKKSKSHKRKHEDVSGETSSDASDSSQDQKRSKKARKEKKEKHKRSKKDKKLKEERKAAKKFLRDNLQGKKGKTTDRDDQLLAPQTQISNIDKDDYFVRNAEFTAWLRDQRGIFFNELESDQARSLFDEFVAEWNGRKLAARYYAGQTASSSLRRTQHQWGIRTGGDTQLGSGAVGMAAAMEEEWEANEAARQGQQVERRKWRAEQKELLDEQLPKATGREAQLEKKAARREAAKEREQSPEINKLPGGGDIMGGDESFAAAKARETRKDDWRSRQQAARQEGTARRAAEAAAKEDAKMAAFRSMLAGGPITIAKRQ